MGNKVAHTTIAGTKNNSVSEFNYAKDDLKKGYNKLEDAYNRGDSAALGNMIGENAANIAIAAVGTKGIGTIGKAGIVTKLDDVGGKKANKADNTNTENSSLASSDPVVQALNNAVPTPGKTNQLETILDDGSKVIFRKDFGNNAHPLNGPNGEFRGQGNVDHYNIEIQNPSIIPGRFESPHSDWHIVPNSGNPIMWDSKDKSKRKNNDRK